MRARVNWGQGTTRASARIAIIAWIRFELPVVGSRVPHVLCVATVQLAGFLTFTIEVGDDVFREPFLRLVLVSHEFLTKVPKSVVGTGLLEPVTPAVQS
jgi:hypothetical protein